jgi:hypothetical protein
MVVGFVVASQRAAFRKMEEDAERERKFDEDQTAFDAGEWAKLPAEAGLWQLIPYTHSRSEAVRTACRARIAARPSLEADMAALLGTGWAMHAVAYLRDAWPLAYAPLAPAFGAFLEKELPGWTTTLHGANPMSWEANISGYFDVAGKIVKEGGNLREPLEKWRSLLEETGMGGLATTVKGLLEPKP